MSQTGVQSISKHGGAHEFTHENVNNAVNLNSLTINAIKSISNGEPMLFKLEEAVSASPLSSEGESYVVRVSPKSVANDAEFGVIKTTSNSRKRYSSIADKHDSNLECANSKTNESSTQSSTPIELDGFAGEDIFQMETETVGVGAETISLPLPITLDSNYLGPDFSDNLKDFVFSVNDGDNLTKSDQNTSFDSVAVDGSSFSALLGSEDSITDTLQVSLYDDSDQVGRIKGVSSHAKEDPTMTSVVSKRNERSIFHDNELLNFTSLLKSSSSPSEAVNVKTEPSQNVFQSYQNTNVKTEPSQNVFQSYQNTNVKTEPSQNVFQSYQNTNENLFLTLKSEPDDKPIPSPFKLSTSSFPPSSSSIITSLSNIGDISSCINGVPILSLEEHIGNNVLKFKSPTQDSGLTSLLYPDAQKEISSTAEQPSNQNTSLSNQNVNVTTISISNKENNSIKILVRSGEGQNVYVINSADLKDGKSNHKLVLNEDWSNFTSAADLSQTDSSTSSLLTTSTSSSTSYFHSNPSSSVSGIFLVPVEPSADVSNEKPSRNKKVMVCPEPGCGKTFKKASKLKVHKMLHTGERPFKCTFPGCIWAFTTSHKLKRHLESHEGRKDFICNYPGCGNKFTTIYNLNTHLKLHDRPYTEACSQSGCGKEFHNKRQLEIHLRTVHGLEEKTFKCPKEGCDKVFYSPGCMGSHMRVHAQSTENFKCKFPDCDREFNKLCRLRQHEKLHTGEKPYICNFEGCTWSFATASKLKRHQTKHTGVRKWQCDICKKFFQRSEHLKGHLITHSGDRPFVCPVQGCGNAFTAKSSLYVHLRKHDESGKTVVYHCPMDKCDRHYACKASLRQHLLVKHCASPPSNSTDNQQLPQGEGEGNGEGVINWLNLLDPNDVVTDVSTDPNLVLEQQLAHNQQAVLAQTALNPSHVTAIINDVDYLAEDVPAVQPAMNPVTGTGVIIADPTAIHNGLIHQQHHLPPPQKVVVIAAHKAVPNITATAPSSPSVSLFASQSSASSSSLSLLSSSTTPRPLPLSASSSLSTTSSNSSSLLHHPTTSAAAIVATTDIENHHHQQLQQQQKVINVGGVLQQPDRMSNETLERGKKRQFVFDNLEGSARTDKHSNDYISQRAFKRWQKQKEVEAAKLRAHLESQCSPSSSTISSSLSSSTSLSSSYTVSMPSARMSVSGASLANPGSSNVSLASQANRGGNSARIFKEIPDLELQAEGLQGSVVLDSSGRPNHTTQSTSHGGDSFMTQLFIKDPETGITYRQTQLLQDDPPTLCLLEDMTEVEPSHNVVLDAGMEGNLMGDSIAFQDL